MFGSHVSARLDLISCRTQLVRNLNHVLDERLHLPVHDMFVRQIAEADFVLYPEEKRQDVCWLTAGGDHHGVDLQNGVLLYMSTIPMGSRNITRHYRNLGGVPGCYTTPPPYKTPDTGHDPPRLRVSRRPITRGSYTALRGVTLY